MSDRKRKHTNEDLYLLLGEMKATLQSVKDNQTKTIYALIALVGAIIGLKTIGTPPLALIINFVKLFVFGFSVFVPFLWRKKIHSYHFVLLYGMFGLVATTLNVFDHKTVLSDLIRSLYLLGNVMLIVFLWKFDVKEESK